jgi:hypothetical protein
VINALRYIVRHNVGENTYFVSKTLSYNSFAYVMQKFIPFPAISLPIK